MENCDRAERGQVAVSAFVATETDSYRLEKDEVHLQTCSSNYAIGQRKGILTSTSSTGTRNSSLEPKLMRTSPLPRPKFGATGM